MDFEIDFQVVDGLKIKHIIHFEFGDIINDCGYTFYTHFRNQNVEFVNKTGFMLFQEWSHFLP